MNEQIFTEKKTCSCCTGEFYSTAMLEVEVYYTLSLEPFAVIVTEAHTPSLSLEPLTC